MSAAVATITVDAYPKGVDNTQRMTIIRGTVAIGASPLTYTTGGIAIVSASNATQSGWAQEPIKVTSDTPIECEFYSVAGSGFVYTWNQASNTLQIFTGAAAQSALTELTGGGAIPAGVSGDTIRFTATFLRV